MLLFQFLVSQARGTIRSRPWRCRGCLRCWPAGGLCSKDGSFTTDSYTKFHTNISTIFSTNKAFATTAPQNLSSRLAFPSQSARKRPVNHIGGILPAVIGLGAIDANLEIQMLVVLAEDDADCPDGS